MDVVLIYILLEDTPEENLFLKGEYFKYLVKVRRHSVDDILSFRSKTDMDILHKYRVKDIQNRTIALEHVSSEEKIVAAAKPLHIAWCIIDSKSIEKVLPSLSEIGVERISFITCERSQNNVKLDLKRFERILEASMQQCGRSTYIKFDAYKNIADFIAVFPQTKVFDFTDKVLDEYSDIETVLVGCEGGFSPTEKELLHSQDIFRLDTPMVLRSESAVMAVSSKVLL